MSGPTVTSVEASKSGAVLYVRYSDTRASNIILATHEEPLRRALNARHKERQAAKKAERRFYACHAVARGCWQVREREQGAAPVTSEHFGDRDEADAKAFAKMLNKRNQKPMGGERDG